MPVLFASTLFLSAMLLFMVQPMIAKMITPMLGGSPAVWNTCSVFFQTLLLFGYLYSHNLTTRFEIKTQLKVHLGVVALAIVYLFANAALSSANSPIGIYKSLAPQGESYPIFGVLLLLTAAIGLPFLIISTSAPLLQRWFAYTGHESAKDPYFLYAASNTGSLLSLLGYPFVIEPRFLPVEQAWIWTGGYLVLLVLVYFCGQAAVHPLRPVEIRGKAAKSPESAEPELENTKPTWLRKLRWLGLAFVPSSLMLGVTTHMTTDIASVPLLWVIPLSLYLLTFIIAFAKTPDWFRPLLANLSPVLSLLLVFVLVSNVMGNRPFYGLLIHLVVYFFTALLMHTELAKARPSVNYLTEYFVWISVGGMFGGLFNALIAPIVFPMDYEYPFAITVGCLLIPVLSTLEGGAKPKSDSAKGFAMLLDILVPIGMIAFTATLTVLPEKAGWFVAAITWIAENISGTAAFLGSDWSIDAGTVMTFALYALPCMLCFFFIDRPLRFGLCVGAVLGVCLYRDAQVKAAEGHYRSYFGIMKIEKYEEKYSPAPLIVTYPEEQLKEDGTPQLFAKYHQQPFHKLLHGTTLHGVQAASRGLIAKRDDTPMLMAMHPWNALAYAGMRESWDSRQEPLTYYHRTGPVGGIFERFREIEPNGHIGMVGLGTGSVSCYAKPGQKLTFYEIDRTVVDIVNEGKYFTYVNDAKARGAEVSIVLGDARLRLEDNKEKYALLLIDAFSSDSIPVHLLTRESMLLYKEQLTERGILALHISNRYIDLEPVVGALAKDAGFECRVFNDNDEDSSGKTRSSWVILAKSEADLGPFIAQKEGDVLFASVAGAPGWLVYDNPAMGVHRHPWRKVKIDKNVDVWTDGYADVLRVMRIDEIRRIRKFFGLPVLSEGE